MSDRKVSWTIFKTELIKHVGRARAQTIFMEQTGYGMNVMQWWRKQDSVPLEAFEKIADIEVAACDNARFKGFHTRQFGSRVVQLSNQNVPIKNISTILSGELGRKVTEGAVKAARFRLKDQIPGYRSRGA